MPVSPQLWGGTTNTPDANSGFTEFPATTFNFLMILGHDANYNETGYKMVNTTAAGANYMDALVNGGLPVTDEEGLWHSHVPYMYPEYDGWSLWTTSNTITQFYVFSPKEHNVGSIIAGQYYDLPHAPELSNLTMTREYGGIKTIETRGGASLSNAFYTKPAKWGDLGAWEIRSSIDNPLNSQRTLGHELSKSGRRIWDLSFSYLDGGDIFGSNQALGTWEYGSQDPEIYGTYDNPAANGDIDLNNTTSTPFGVVDNAFAYNLLTDYSFFSQVIHKTNGQLPFIFQPNKDDNTTFAICKFDQNSFSFQQTAPNLYSCKMKIREVW